MTTDITQRAEVLDKLREKGVADKLTLKEARNIVSVWGKYLEYSGGIRFLFGIDIPKSLLPYPIEILQAAINKVKAYYHSQGQHERVKLLEETEMILIQYTDDEEAIQKARKLFGSENWRKAMLSKLTDLQKDQLENGYLVDSKLCKLSKSRIDELINSSS